MHVLAVSRPAVLLPISHMARRVLATNMAWPSFCANPRREACVLSQQACPSDRDIPPHLCMQAAEVGSNSRCCHMQQW
jgi:hypothetical protein